MRLDRTPTAAGLSFIAGSISDPEPSSSTSSGNKSSSSTSFVRSEYCGLSFFRACPLSALVVEPKVRRQHGGSDIDVCKPDRL